MPQGYLVQLADGSLDPGDGIVGGLFDFTTQTVLGAGQWIWSGTWNGTTFTNELEPGVYILGSNGNVYFVPDFGPVDTLTSASVVSAPGFLSDVDDNVIDGTDLGELIDNTFTDADGDQVDDGSGGPVSGLGDTVDAKGGNDTVFSGAGDDVVYGGAGQDTIDGGAGDDILYGDAPEVTSQAEFLSWSAAGADEASIADGIVQTTGGMTVSVSFQDDGDNNPLFQVESTDSVYVEPGEPFSPTSNLYLFGNGRGATSTTTIDFSAAPGSGYAEEVQNVSFRLNDIDFGGGNHRDVVTVNAFDAQGNPVAVSFTLGGGDNLSGNTITADNQADNFDQVGGSALIEIAGPVASIEIIYSNAQRGTQAVWVTDIHFETIPITGDDDTIAGGTGDDTMFGGAGDDIFTVAEGDTASGGDGDDTFLITDLGEAGAGTISIDGGETGETAGDTLNFQNQIQYGSLTYTNTDDLAGGLSGTATLLDGTTVNFTGIETVIICFTAGTRILTPAGERRIETLSPGDLVVTADHGPQPVRWIGMRRVRAEGAFAPVVVSAGAMDNAADLVVSPQHRMLVSGWRAELLFGRRDVLVAAKALADGDRIRVREGGTVTYVHLLFDRHEIIYANGAPSESFHPGAVGVGGLLGPAREELFRLFPELRADPGSYGPTSRLCVKPREARALLGA